MTDCKLVPSEATIETGWAYLEASEKSDPDTRHTFNHQGYSAMLAAAPALHGDPVGWQFYQDGKWWYGDDCIKVHRKNTEEAGFRVRDVYAAQQPAEQQPSPDVAGLAARLSKVIMDLESGFVTCERCGDQEDTATLDCMPELTAIRNALAAHRKQGADL